MSLNEIGFFFSGKSNGNIAFKAKYLKCWRWLSIFLSITCLLAVVSAKHAKKCSKMPEMKGHQNKPLEEGNKNIPNFHEYKKLHKMNECKNMPKLQECKKGKTIDLSEPSHPPYFHDLTKL